MTTVLPRVAALLALAGFACSCGAPKRSEQTARVADEWTRSYPFEAGVELQIVNTSGSVDVEIGQASTIDVRAERVAHATSDQGARDLLSHIDIAETADPGHRTIETQRIKGLIIGASFDVHYTVKLPAAAAIRVRNSDGDVRATGLGGKASLTCANGSVVGRALSGTVEVRATNGNADVELATGSAQFVDVRVVNGRLELAVPKAFAANLSATAVNGRVQVNDIEFESFGDPVRDTRRVRGRINGGGIPIELSATNGSIRVSGYE